MSLFSQAGQMLERAANGYRDLTAYPRPICRLVVNGTDITNAIEARLISIELTDNRGLEADQLDISLSDHDGLLAIPPRGATLELWLGWSDTGLVEKGTFTVDETEHSGAPDTLSIRARSADMRGGLKVKRERSWDGTPLAFIISAIATAYGLTPLVGAGDNLKELRHSYTDQASALQAARAEWKRLQRGTATLSYTLAKGRPELIPDQTYSLTGIKAEIAAIVWLGGNIRHSFTPDAFTTSLELESQLPDGDDITGLADENAGYTGIVAWYRDEKTGKQHKLTEGDQTNPRRLTHLYQSKASAQRAVKREIHRLLETG